MKVYKNNDAPFPRRWLLAGAVALALPGPVLADAVTDWNAEASAVVATAGGPPQQFRLMAMTHIAIHDALNAVDPRFRAYTVIGAGNPNASPEAAVASAARGVLVATVSAQAGAIDAFYASYLAGLPPCPAAHPTCIADGEAIGAAAAAAIVDLRTLDGSETPHVPYTLAPGPGVYQPTLPTPPPPAPFPQFGGWGKVKPFALNNNKQFWPGRKPVLNLKSDAYARDYNEVKQVGSFAVRNAAPDSEPSQIARFFPGGGGNPNGPARAMVADAGLDLWESARLFALMNMAVNDTLVVTFNVKYHFNFWRPQTAIHWANDGNPATQPDPDWSSYIVTPPYPDYTCGLPSVMGSSTAVLHDVFGTDHVPFTFTAVGLPPAVTRSYSSLAQWANDAANARVYGGIHFRTGCMQAVRLGRKVGHFVFANELQPL